MSLLLRHFEKENQVLENMNDLKLGPFNYDQGDGALFSSSPTGIDPLPLWP